MNIRNNKGVTGVDLSVALIIIVLFVGIISSLVYNFAVTSRNVNRKSIATDIAIGKIENLKQDFINNGSTEDPSITKVTTSEYGEVNETTGAITFYERGVPNENVTPYIVDTVITKYSDYTDSSYISSLSNDERSFMREKNLLKIVEVTVTYSNGNREENVNIKTAITRED